MFLSQMSMPDCEKMADINYSPISQDMSGSRKMNQLGITRGNLSSNLRKPEEAGYLNIKKEFIDRIPRSLIRLTVVMDLTIRGALPY
jgi:hypothetical protein